MGKDILTARDYPDEPMEKVGSVFTPARKMTDQEAIRTIRRTYLGQCEVAGCTARAVAYHASAAWRLCASHSALLARRGREKYV